MTRPWYTKSVARALLASCASNPPRILRHRKAYVLTTDEWLTYDDADPRVAKLAVIQSVHFGKHGDRIALGCSVDHAIDAVRDQPRIFNINNPDERDRGEAIRAGIFGNLEGKAA